MDSGTDGGTAPAFAWVDFSEETSGEEASEDGVVRICKACMTSRTASREHCPDCGDELVPIRAIRESYAGEVVGDKFKLVEKIGSGGMGEVYLGYNEPLDQRVAVKFLSKEYIANEQVIMRFLNEARSYCKVTHPNAVTLLDYGQHDDGALYIITEYIEGASLRDVVEDESGLPPRRAVSIVDQCCSVLSTAHEQGVIHRDLKPDNVMLVPESGGGFAVKVLDFGIAKIVDDDREPLTETGSVFGTPEFMSPEQAKGVPVDPRADIYALGIILYFSLTGEIPFDGESQFSVLEKQINETPPRPTDAISGAEIPLPLEAVILKCLNKRPEERYESAASLSEALDEAAAELGLEGANGGSTPSTVPPGGDLDSPDTDQGLGEGTSTPAYPSELVRETASVDGPPSEEDGRPEKEAVASNEPSSRTSGEIDLSAEYTPSVLDLGRPSEGDWRSQAAAAVAAVSSAVLVAWLAWGTDGGAGAEEQSDSLTANGRTVAVHESAQSEAEASGQGPSPEGAAASAGESGVASEKSADEPEPSPSPEEAAGAVDESEESSGSTTGEEVGDEGSAEDGSEAREGSDRRGDAEGEPTTESPGDDPPPASDSDETGGGSQKAVPSGDPSESQPSEEPSGETTSPPSPGSASEPTATDGPSSGDTPSLPPKQL